MRNSGIAYHGISAVIGIKLAGVPHEHIHGLKSGDGPCRVHRSQAYKVVEGSKCGRTHPPARSGHAYTTSQLLDVSLAGLKLNCC